MSCEFSQACREVLALSMIKSAFVDGDAHQLASAHDVAKALGVDLSADGIARHAGLNGTQDALGRLNRGTGFGMAGAGVGAGLATLLTRNPKTILQGAMAGAVPGTALGLSSSVAQ